MSILATLLGQNGSLWERLLSLPHDWDFVTDSRKEPGVFGRVAHYGGHLAKRFILADNAYLETLGDDGFQPWGTVPLHGSSAGYGTPGHQLNLPVPFCLTWPVPGEAERLAISADFRALGIGTEPTTATIIVYVDGRPGPRFSCGPEGDKERFDGLAASSTILGELASSTAMRDSVEPLINQPYRLIESYALRRDKDSVFYLHNGNSEILHYAGRSVQRNMSFSHTFHDDKLYCMFVKVLIYLTDVTVEEDGPFCYLQGSHKANWPWFTDSKLDQPELTKANFPSLDCVSVQAGDAIVLNEALLHGTLPKSSPGERLLMAFSYAPAFVANWEEIDKDSSDITKLGHY